ncbi:Hypothetical predicted protein [Cloeon dipterum]|uniref:PIH1 N-terminal domain-containing protein n=2 Tax=Cloeon dipterum TaxID=197152 RepID=A0A8S1E1N2_9INSE|nr:Hypothetical predicted protein [Cloeon dipterum]
MSQTASLRTGRVSRIQFGDNVACENTKNWLMDSESLGCGGWASNPAEVQPEGRYVLKVWTQGREKVMINVCAEHDGLLHPRSVRGGLALPHSVSRPRRDTDLKKQPCKVVDVTFGGHALALADQSDFFRQHLHLAALNAAQSALGMTLQKDRVATPKLVCKGSPEGFRLARLDDDSRLEVSEDSTGFSVQLHLPSDLSGHRLTYSLAQDYLEVDLRSHQVVIHLPYKVQGLKEEPKYLQNQSKLVFHLLKIGIKAAKSGFFLVNQPVSHSDSDVDEITQKIGDVHMETGSTSSGGSDEEKTFAHEDDLSSTENNNQKLKEPSEKLDNQKCDDQSQNRLNNINKRLRILATKTRSISESSDDWSMCQSPCKGILKGSFSFSGDLAASCELSELNEETAREVGSANSVKKSVSFSDVISKQLFRADSSILGQRKKNQRKARNKRKSSQRKHTTSESEDVTSEAETSSGKEGQEMMFDIDM